MPRKKVIFDELDLKILSTIPENPLNLVEVARKIGAPRETVRRRVLQLRERVRVYALPDYDALSLSLILAITEGFKDNWITELTRLNYLASLHRMYTRDGIRGLLIFYWPKGREGELEALLRNELGTESIYEVREFLRKPNFLLYSPRENRWKIDWDSLIEDTLNGKRKARLELSPPRKFDGKDLFIIKKLMENALTTITNIAKELKVNARSLLYHFHEHVPRLIKGYTVKLTSLDPSNYHRLYLMLSFSTTNNMLNFIGAVRDLPIIDSLMATAEVPKLSLFLNLPSAHLLDFMKSLNVLLEERVIEEIEVMGLLDPSITFSQTIPYGSKVYKRGWIMEEEFKELKDLLKG